MRCGGVDRALLLIGLGTLPDLDGALVRTGASLPLCSYAVAFPADGTLARSRTHPREMVRGLVTRLHRPAGTGAADRGELARDRASPDSERSCARSCARRCTAAKHTRAVAGH